jgi:predicted RNase H-like HicB family nuclease
MVRFTLQYWQDGPWYVGQLLELPDVMSQGATLAELETNIREAYQLMAEERRARNSSPGAQMKPIAIPA